MPLKAGLTPETASRICMHECRAQCCQGPLYLRLTAQEVRGFQAKAAALGVALHVFPEVDGGGSIRFPDYDGERCPMLDEATSACRIYEERPQRCREFPDRARPECPISGET